ncbi:glycosyltransferase family A protein [Mariniflexile aquimaris]|uniref:Glycosyltransferase family A protein n=1 Tax=Mariniflexile aquimaris TaxID=881009 RepID=A0ABW3BRU5_9FLAO
MRDGVNPEKYKGEKNKCYFHRIIIPVYIPNNQEEYYSNSIEVLDACLNSLIQTINFETTAITLINNNSSEFLIQPIMVKYKAYIDKFVIYGENKGKVYPVFSEAKAAYEPFITIADADLLFFSGWESAVFEIFKDIKKAGVVSPLPLQSLALNKNNSVFFDNYFFGRIKYDKIVSDNDNDLYLKGLFNPALFNRRNRTFSWKEKQYYLKNNVTAVLGAGHFCATYRKAIFNFETEFPEMKFINGYEDIYLDEPADRNGWYRLSTAKSYAYHIGNKIDDFVLKANFDNELLLNSKIFKNIKNPSKSIVPYRIKIIFFKIIKKLMKL